MPDDETGISAWRGDRGSGGGRHHGKPGRRLGRRRRGRAAGNSRDADPTEAMAGPDGEAIAGGLEGATPQITQRIWLLRELRVAVQRRETLYDQLATSEAQVAQRQEQRLAAAEETVELARNKRPLVQTQQALLAAQTAYLEERADLPRKPGPRSTSS